jgi:hypothetical protein
MLHRTMTAQRAPITFKSRHADAALSAWIMDQARSARRDSVPPSSEGESRMQCLGEGTEARRSMETDLALAA